MVEKVIDLKFSFRHSMTIDSHSLQLKELLNARVEFNLREHNEFLKVLI